MDSLASNARKLDRQLDRQADSREGSYHFYILYNRVATNYLVRRKTCNLQIIRRLYTYNRLPTCFQRGKGDSSNRFMYLNVSHRLDLNAPVSQCTPQTCKLLYLNVSPRPMYATLSQCIPQTCMLLYLNVSPRRVCSCISMYPLDQYACISM